MSKYTIELRKIIEYEGRDTVENYFKDYCIYNYLRQNEVESILNANIWSKDRLASKIVDHYFMREIGYETIGLFKHYAKVYMQEIMERYLPLIFSNSIEYNILNNADYEEQFSRNIKGNGESESSSTNDASEFSVNSDTPQGNINKESILSGDYATNTMASETNSTINDSSRNLNNTDETYTKKIKGTTGSTSPQKMIQLYRKNIIAIDEQIIKELDKLFMGLY